jgi:hypothetical protein
MTEDKLKGLGFVDMYENCKRMMLTTYNKNFKTNQDESTAYDSAKKSLRKCINKWGIENKSQIFGLYAELNYYHHYFKDQQLTAEMAIGYHSDFRGIIGNRNAAIDVTSNPSYKDPEQYAEIKGRLHNDWDYYIGVSDIPSEDSIYHPFLLPICSDGEIGHFIRVLETTTPEARNLYGDLVDRQYLIKYNPNCGGMDSDSVEEVLCTNDYLLMPPKAAMREIRDSWEDALYENPDDPEILGRIDKEIDNYYQWLVTDFRHETGFIISAIAQLDQMLEINDFDIITRQFWVHPHEYIRSKLGNPNESMDFNIAGYLYDVY